MDQRIEAPTDSDVDRIARQLIHAESVVIDIAGAASMAHAQTCQRFSLFLMRVLLNEMQPTRFSQRIEDGERVDVEALFNGLSQRLVELSEEQRSET